MKSNPIMDPAARGAMGDMIRDSWKQGRRTGLLEGFLIGFLLASGVIALKVFA